MPRRPADLVAPLVAGSLVALAAVLTLLPIALAIGHAAPDPPAAGPSANRSVTVSPPPSTTTPGPAADGRIESTE